ncbi:MAG: efflux RND transporter periplasmic adaptor subunit [Cyclobacteriaceae bacterium]|nr:efflux RND transporter periplasmic adaptor subunit [Cyclobacteriaceae bacterium]
MRNILLFSIGAILLMACGSKKQEQAVVVDSLSANMITLTSSQYKASNITLGKVERKPVAKQITVNGKLDVPPQNLVIISAPMGGFVKSTQLLQGMKVKKGDVLTVLENQEYIQLQQDYLDSSSKLEFLQMEYNRQQELAKENVNAQKALQQSKSQYESMKAMVSGLEAKLAMINLSPASIKNGRIKSTVNLTAPIDGFITTVNVNIGQFVTPTEVMFKIVNLEHMHAELQVYEKDINKIAVGQKVTFQLANDTAIYNASVYLVGKEISPERTVRIHCHLDKVDKSLLPGMFVTANIETVSAEADVVPTTSISNFEGKDYIFVSSSDNQFKAIRVNTGIAVGEFTEVQLLEKLVAGAPIVTLGAFELMGLLKNKQE